MLLSVLRTPMGSTARQHRYQVPLTNRSTDLSVLNDCPGRYLLTLIHEKEQAEASYFALGTLLHEGIEHAIDSDVSQDFMLKVWLPDEVDKILKAFKASDKRLIESSQRGLDTIHSDSQRMMSQWFDKVHPDSKKRLSIYDDYEWPPQTEVFFHDSKKNVWGSIDAVFQHATKPAVRAMVDWKSGTKKQKNSFQLHFYMYGIGFSHYQTKAWFHHLDRVQARSIIQMIDSYPGDEKMVEAGAEAYSMKLAMLDGDMPKFNPDWWCNYCPVQDFCPADGDTRNRPKNRRNLKRVLRLLRPLKEPINT